MSFPSDLEIARGANLLPLTDIAADAGIPADCLEPYGEGAAKIKLCAVEQMSDRPDFQTRAPALADATTRFRKQREQR